MRVQEIRIGEPGPAPGRRRIPLNFGVFAPPALVIPFGKIIVTGYPPTITEYAKGTIVYVGGVDVTQYLAIGSGGSGFGGSSGQLQAIRIHKQSIGRGTATLDFVAAVGGFTPGIAQPVRIVDWGVTLFSGMLQTVQADRQGIADNKGFANMLWHCTAVDRAGICDHRIVLKSYAIADWPDYSNVILDIVASYLNGEGITTGGVAPIGSNVYGPLAADLNWSYPTVTQAFDQIAKDAGLVWWINQDGVLYFASFVTTVGPGSFPAAPFSLTETSGTWRWLMVTQDLATYFNKLYAIGNQNAQPAANSQSANGDETFTMLDNFPGIIPNPNDPDLNQSGPAYVPLGVRTSQSIAAVTSVTWDHIHPQSVYKKSDYHGQAPIDGFDLIWLWTPGSNELRWVRQPANTGDIVEVVYTPVTATTSAGGGGPLSNISAAAANTPLTGTLGSGVYEGTFQVANYTNLSDLQAEAVAALARWGGIPLIADYETDQQGLEPGQLQTVNVPLCGSTNQKLLITSVDLQHEIGDLLAGSGKHSSFRATVQARSNLDPGNWLKWFERQFQRNQLVVANFEEAIFVIGTDGSTNPWPVSRSGPVFQATFSATTPPGQTLTFQLVRTTTPAPFPPGQLGGRFNVGPAFSVPGGQINDTVYTILQPGVQVSQYDILSLTVTIVGGGTIPAGCVLKVRWQVS